MVNNIWFTVNNVTLPPRFTVNQYSDSLHTQYGLLYSSSAWDECTISATLEKA